MTTVKPVLVTGAPRSGTTWVGNMLSASEELYYVHEPFNPDYPPGHGICNIRFPHHQTYITEENEAPYYKPVRDMIDGKYNFAAEIRTCRSMADFRRAMDRRREFRKYREQNRRPLIKDPIALLSAGWLGRRFDINIVVMIRHPAAFVASMKRLKWGFDQNLWALSQPLLLRDYLSPFEDELRRFSASGGDTVEQAALLWKIAYYVVSEYRTRYPEWYFLKHEDLSRDPLTGYQKMFGNLGISFTENVRNKVIEYSDESNPSHSSGAERLLKLDSRKSISQWKKALTMEEVRRIQKIVGDVSTLFYADDEWE